ncbi:hypothetical protein DVH24_018915 [Malus domestica]|uniref:Uncharacterized protein n=1 Tax=Malus domestica TaxID=3750 RepID=A0A498HLH5_MALDO|nr:hypothetical protein DVH24_018915 [Malus domestica]
MDYFPPRTNLKEIDAKKPPRRKGKTDSHENIILELPRAWEPSESSSVAGFIFLYKTKFNYSALSLLKVKLGFDKSFSITSHDQSDTLTQKLVLLVRWTTGNSQVSMVIQLRKTKFFLGTFSGLWVISGHPIKAPNVGRNGSVPLCSVPSHVPNAPLMNFYTSMRKKVAR